MATKTTGGSMYSGLLQTNQELAKAKAEASAGVGKGLAEGFKPLQGYLMGVAAKEQKRLDQLDSDMGIAGAYLGKMADTAGILGEFEQEITDFGVTTKNLLNDIAKDESLNQFEKQAKYVEAVNAFNKRVSLYSGDQEIIAGLSGRFANGTISKANNLTGDDYLIGRALATGNFTVKNGQYSIFDDNKQQIKVTGDIDSNRIRNLYVTDTKYDFDKISAGYAKIGAASKTEEELQNNIRQAALGFGTKESALAQLVEGEYHEYEAIKDNTLQQLQDLIYDAGYNTAKQTFIKAKPKEKLLGTAEQMGMRMMGVYDSAMNSKNYNAFLGMELGGATVTSFDINETNPNKIQFYRTDPKGRLVTIAEELDLTTDKNTIITAITMGSDGTDTQKNEALNFISTYTPLSVASSSGDSDGEDGGDGGNEDPNKITGIMEAGEYPEYITNASTERINAADARKILGLRKGRAIPMPLLTHLQDNYSVIETDEETKKKKRAIAFTEKNLLEAAFNTNSKLKDSSGKFLGREKYNQNIKNNIKQGEDESTLLNNINIANVSGVVNNPRQYESEMRKLGILADSQTALEITPKDIAVLKYMKATGKTLKQSRTALADLQAKNADKAEAAMATG
jgi:hypothetical protein